VFQLNITEDDTSLEQALAYYDDGYNVVPLQRSNKKPPPFLGSWEQYKESRPPRTLVESWFKDRQNLQVALVCGKFIVVDADSPRS
jgi:hypothetical protein